MDLFVAGALPDTSALAARTMEVSTLLEREVNVSRYSPKVYGHLGTVRHRADAVEYRVEQYKAKLGDRLDALLAANLAPPMTPRG